MALLLKAFFWQIFLLKETELDYLTLLYSCVLSNAGQQIHTTSLRQKKILNKPKTNTYAVHSSFNRL